VDEQGTLKRHGGGKRGDRGFAVMQSLFVVGVVGAGSFGITALGRVAIAEAQRVACATDRHVVQTAIQSHLIMNGDLAPVGSGPDRFELAIVAGGFLTEPSRYYDVTADGQVVPADNRC
jgi:hypothetical protein